MVLKALKVNLKIKTVNFQVFSRTKTLNSYTNETGSIYEGAKFLFLNEWENANGKLRLRLIGVRVSDLREKNTELSNSPNKNQSNGMKTLDHFFKKSEKLDNEDEDLILLKENLNFMCPHCSSYLEGNEDFYYQHLDSCLW